MTAALVVAASSTWAQNGASTLKGRGYAVYIDVPGVVANTYYGDTGWLPAQGGPITESATNVEIEGVLSAASIDVTSDNDALPYLGETRVTLQNTVILPGHVGEIAFSSISSDDDDDDDECDEDDDRPGAATIEGLRIGGIPVLVTGELNQIVAVPGIGTMTINELGDPDDDDDACEDDDDDFAINALHMRYDGGGEVIVGSSYYHFDDECCEVAIDPETWSNVKILFR
jgi:hypothetical protein